jgi:hypothetical protein
MLLSFSINGVPIRLTKERWSHISHRHPELEGKEQHVLNAIVSPDLIQKGDVGTLMAVKKSNDKYLVAVYKEISESDGFVITAYYTKFLRKRVILWKR